MTISPRKRLACWIVVVLSVVNARATETEFWRPYSGPDEAAYLLAPLDDDALPAGSAKVTKAEERGHVELVEGRFGRGLHFDGSSSVRYATGEIFPGGYISIEAWVKLDRLPEKRAYLVHRPARVDPHAAYDPEKDLTKGFGLFVDGEGALHLEITNCGYGHTILTASKPGAVPVGRWVHVAGISANFPISHRRLFVDGGEVASEAITWGKGLIVHGEEEKEPGPLYLGNSAAADAGLAGTLDQVRIHRQIGRFWADEKEPWIAQNRPGEVPDGPPHFAPAHRPRVYLPLDGGPGPQGAAPKDLQVKAGGPFAPGVCGKAALGSVELGAPDLLDLREGTIEFWLRPGGVNSISDRNRALVRGPFIFYIYNSGGLRNKPLALYFRKPDGELHFVKIEGLELHPGRWYHFVIAWREDEIALYADGRPGERSYGVPLATDPKRATCGQLVLGTPRSRIDEVRLYDKALSPLEAANAYWRYVDRARLVAVQPAAIALRMQYFPSRSRIVYRLQPESAEMKRAVLVLRAGGGEEVLREQVEIVPGEQELEVPDLADGTYALSVSAAMPDGALRRGGEVEFRRKHFDWEGKQLGTTEEVFPPFEPIRTDGSTVAVVGRRHALNGFGLPESITSAGRELLAGSVEVRYETSQGEGRFAFEKCGFTTTRRDLAVFEAAATSPAVKVTTRSQIEIDGCMKVAMHLLPGEKPQPIERLWLEIPLRDAEAPLMHAVTAGLRSNYSGAVPDGQGRIWDGSKAHQYQRWLNAFVPYVWLGSPNRGLAWFAENDRGWITEKTPAGCIQELVRQGDRLVLRVYLVNRRATIAEPHELVFGLQASPTKPMPEAWRARVRHAPGGLAVVPWGGLECASQAPWRDDWQVVDKIAEVRTGKPFDREWFAAYAEKHRPPPAHGHWPWLDAVGHFAHRVREAGPDRPVAVYQEEMRGCPARPEWAVFQDEWTAEPHRFQRTVLPDRVFERGYEGYAPPEKITFPRSYQDFGCAIAQQWLSRGVSLYWDNTYPYASTNTRTTAAYRTEDGRVQPCMIVWSHREYGKRVWHLLQQWQRKRTEPLEFTLHMTNTLLLPVHTWGTVNLDHELDTDEPFSPEWLQAETVGRQVGNLPLTLYHLTGKAQKALLGMSSDEKALTEWGMRAVHEVGHRSGPMEEALTAFGYGTPSVEVHNYWADRPAMRVKPEPVKWLLVARPEKKEYLLVLASWSEEPGRVELAIDRDLLGFSPDGPARDLAGDRKAGEVRQGRLTLEVERKYQVKVLRVRATEPLAFSLERRLFGRAGGRAGRAGGASG